MTYQDFINKYNGKGIDFDGFYGYQCMDLAHQYAVEVVGKDIPAVPGAKDEWNQTIDGYDKITNSPDNVPQQGDIVVWGDGVGAYGHIAIFDHGDTNSFVSFDQNWPLNSLCHFQNHNYTGVLGWFHPHTVIDTPTPPTITDQTKIPQINDMEVQAIRSTLDDQQNTINSLQAQIANQNSELVTAKQLIGQMQTQISTNQPVVTNVVSEPQFSTYFGKLFYSWAKSLG